MIKRKRNKKLESDARYDVLMDSEIDITLLEPYKASNLNSGMEAEEEKEHHLKTIMAQGSGKIPTPVVEELSRCVDAGEYRRPKDLIRWEGDSKNEVLLDVYDTKFIEENNISESEFYNLLNDTSSLKDTSKSIKDYIRKRAIKISRDWPQDAYSCFRKRIIKLPRKSRRSEANVNERLRRMWVELSTLKSLYELHIRRCELEKEYLGCNKEIIDIGLGLDPGDSMRREIQKKISRKRASSRRLEYYRTCGPFKELVCNREKVKALREFLYKIDPKISSLDLEREAKALEDYKRRKFSFRGETQAP